MALQYLAIVEEAVRGTDPGSGYLFPAIVSTLMPEFTPEDRARDEFRGQDSGLGNTVGSVVRDSSQWSMAIEMAWYPGAETNLLFKHLMGKANARTVIDTTAYDGLFLPLTQPYGAGREQGTKAIGIIPNFDKEGTTRSRYFGGGRIKSLTITGEGSGDTMLSFEISGPGQYVATADAAAIPTSSFEVNPFVAKDILLYTGTGITRAGTPPDYTFIGGGVSDAFLIDKFSVTITNGIDDKNQYDGVEGPSKTTRTGKFSVEFTGDIDFEDQPAGFSPYDAYEALYADPDNTEFIIVGDNGELAGAATSNFAFVVDMPRMKNNSPAPVYSADGTAPIQSISYSSLVDDTTTYPAAIQTTDQEATV